MSHPADIHVITGATMAPEEWSTSQLDWEDPFGERAAAAAAAERGEPPAKQPRVVFPPSHESEQQGGVRIQEVDTITVGSSPSDRISPEQFNMATPEGSGSQRTPTQQATASSPTERSGAGGGQLGVLQSTAAQPSYHAYNGLERELLSNANARAFGVDTAAPPTWTDSTHL